MATLALSPTQGLTFPTKTSTTTTQPAPLPGALPGVPGPQPTAPTAPLPLGDPKTLPVAPTSPSLTPTTPTPLPVTSPTPQNFPIPNPTPLPITEPPPIAGLPGSGSATGSTGISTGAIPLPTPSPITAPVLPSIPSTPASLSLPPAASQPMGSAAQGVGTLPSALSIAPDQSIDRTAIAKDLLAQFDPLTEAKFRDDLRSATGQAAGLGQLGSGMWRTSLSNIAADRSRERDAYGRQVMDAALSGKIEDYYRDVGIRQQQQAAAVGQSLAARDQDLRERMATGQMSAQQAQLELSRINSDRQYALQSAAQQLQAQVASGQLSMQQAQLLLAQQAQMFGQAVTQTQLQDLLTNSAFNRNSTLLQLGNQGNPADILLQLSNLFGSQAGAAQQSLMQLLAQGQLSNALSQSGLRY